MSTRRKATITIYDGDDLAELQRLRVAVQDAIEAEDGTTPSNADSAAEDARLAYNEFLNGPAAERATKIVLQALRWDVWDEMEAAHPPRMVDEEVPLPNLAEADEKSAPTTRKVPHRDDVDFDVDTKTLPQVLVPASVVEPAGFDPSDLSKPDYLRLFFAALALNRQGADPKEISPFVSDLESADE